MDASISSGGWDRASDLPGFDGMLLPSELDRNSQSQRWDSNPLTPLYRSGTRLVENRRLSCRVAGGSRTHNGLTHNQFSNPPEFGHSASTWNRTRNTAFAEPDDVPFTIEASRSVPRPGIEPGPALSERAMMSVSPSGHTVPGAGVEPASTVSGTAVLPLDDPGMKVAREGVEPSRPVGTAF